MSKRPETTQDWLDRYESRRIRAFDNYQSTGEQRYDRQEEEYSVICDALRAKLETEKEREVDVKKRMNNMKHVTDNLMKDEYTKDEVIEMLQKAVWW